MSGMTKIKDIAQGLLNRNPNPIQYVIITRDLLGVPISDRQLIEAIDKSNCHRWVRELEEAQETNGTWGRFHSQDSSLKKKFPTTENAVNRALSLGLTTESSILRKAVSFMSGMISGVESWSDRVEKFNEWPITTKMITASVLSRVNRIHPALDSVWELWAKITESAFENGGHNLTRELNAFEEITGIRSTKRDSKLNKLYPLILLSATKNNLSSETEKAYLEWIWDYNEGIYYLTWFSLNTFPEITSKAFPFWLRAIDIFSDFSYGKTLAKDSVNYLWSLRDKDGLWDFGKYSKSAGYAKTSCGWQLSEDWRDSINRQLDCTLRILLLLKKHSEQG